MMLCSSFDGEVPMATTEANFIWNATLLGIRFSFRATCFCCQPLKKFVSLLTHCNKLVSAWQREVKYRQRKAPGYQT